MMRRCLILAAMLVLTSCAPSLGYQQNQAGLEEMAPNPTESRSKEPKGDRSESDVLTGRERKEASPSALPDNAFLEKYATTDRFRLGEPKSIQVTPSGDAVLFLRSGPTDFTQSLYSVDPATGTETLLLDATQILKGQTEELTQEESALRERLRLAAKGIASYELSPDGEWVLVNLAGRMHLLERKTGKLNSLPSTGGSPFDPQFSPDGTKIAFVQNDELHVVEISTGEAKQLTSSENPNITNGISEFVAQEEMSRHHGYWWSPDSRSLLYQQTDHTGMETMHIMDPTAPEVAPNMFPYPRPGKKNADVRLGLISVKGGETTWVEWDRDAFEYLATVKWTAHGPLTLVVQNRTQTQELILAVNTQTGATRMLHEETHEAWIDLDQTFPYWLPGEEGFLWLTERGGEPQIEKRNKDGSFAYLLTPKDFGLRKVVQVMPNRGELIIVAAKEPSEAYLWSVRMQKGMQGVQRLTKAEGLWDAVTNTDGFPIVTRYASTSQLPTWTIQGENLTDRELKVLRLDPGFMPDLHYSQVGGEAFRAVEIRPKNFDPGITYPVIVHVYGGPTSVMVRKTAARYLLNQWIADHGYVVVAFDGRGTPYRGTAWHRTVKNDLISLPLEDQVVALKAWAADRPYADISRTGIYGWSFGGYFSAMAVMRYPEVFQVGVAGAPVVQWEDYDTHYTERYMNTPQANPTGYDAANVLTYAKDLERPLLIIHGTADDNVYFMHSLKLVDALFKNGKAFDFLPLAGSTHRVKDPTVTKRMYQNIMNYFEAHLKE